MKKALLAGVAGAAVIAGIPANAADLGTRPTYQAPPVVAPIPVFSWTGCYIGGHIGGGWERKKFSDPNGAFFTPPGEAIQVNASGFLGGGQLGCDWQLAPKWVIGIEGAAAWADLKGDTLDVFTHTTGGGPFQPPSTTITTGTFSVRTDFLASATGRIGWVWDRWLLYAKGGAAWDHDKYSFVGRVTAPGIILGGSGFAPFDFAASETRTGWTVGAGVEWAFWTNWSAKLEYDFYGFGSRQVIFVSTSNNGMPPLSADIAQQIHTVKFGINYRFSWGKAPGPIAAKY
jgi:outer membrane immunogenic protein